MKAWSGIYEPQNQSKELDHDAWKSEILVDWLSLVGFEKVLAKKLLDKKVNFFNHGSGMLLARCL